MNINVNWIWSRMISSRIIDFIICEKWHYQLFARPVSTQFFTCFNSGIREQITRKRVSFPVRLNNWLDSHVSVPLPSLWRCKRGNGREKFQEKENQYKNFENKFLFFQEGISYSFPSFRRETLALIKGKRKQKFSRKESSEKLEQESAFGSCSFASSSRRRTRQETSRGKSAISRHPEEEPEAAAAKEK